MNADAVFYRGFRYPAEIISHCVWLYYRFPLSFREVEEMMLARGVVVSHETIQPRTQRRVRRCVRGWPAPTPGCIYRP